MLRRWFRLLLFLQARLKERAKQTKEIVIEQYKQEELAAKEARQGPKEMGDIDTDDENDQEAEFESWRGRELRRIRCLFYHTACFDIKSPSV